MKFILVFALGMVVSSVGLVWVKRLLIRIKQLEQVVMAINILKDDIRYTSKETDELFTKLHMKFPDVFPFGYTNPTEFIESTIANDNLLLLSEEKEDLRLLLVGIGKTDVLGQLEHSRVYLDKFENHLRNLRKKSSNQIKVYPTLSILVGLMCVVLLV